MENPEKMDHMELPKYFGLVKIMAQIVAIIGCISGGITILTGLWSGLTIGLSSIILGGITIAGSLAALGVSYCFLAMVKAQIESRNAIIRYTSMRS